MLDRIMRLLGILLVAIALVACGSSSGEVALHCGPTGAHTIASDRLARVYSRSGSVYGCSMSGSRKSYRLGASSRSIHQNRAGPVALGGALAAYGLSAYGVDTVGASVAVRRLTDGKQLKQLPATTAPLRPEFFQSVGSIVVKADGAVAWIGSAGSVIGGQRTDIEVHRSDARGQALLASGSAIDPGSLRRHGSTLTWRDGSATRSAKLR